MTLANPQRSKVEEVARAASDSGRTQWLGYVVESEPADLLGCYARASSDDRFLWQRGPNEAAFVAWGCVDEIECAGSQRFQDVEAWTAEVLSRLHWLGASRESTAPLFVGGFGFEESGPAALEWKGFPAARVLLPGTIAEQRGSGGRLTLLVRVEPGARASAIVAALEAREQEAIELGRRARAPVPPATDSATQQDMTQWREHGWPAGPEYRVRSDRAHSVFVSQVAHALEAIDAGDLEKIVLARSLRVDHGGPLDVPGFLQRLATLYPSCTLVSMCRGDDTFLAATPETLVRVEGDRVETAALAGSAPRGRTPEEDRTLAESLRSSAKERAEHAHVVDAYRNVLARACSELEVSQEPSLRQLFGIQHLETSMRGRLRRDASVAGSNPLLGLVAALHPTPAVGGVPREDARTWLRRCEGLDRGWYASPVGWLDANGGGDFCVALRSALIHQESGGSDAATSRALLFAGAGIVEGSAPERELAETRTKLRALLAPLTEI